MIVSRYVRCSHEDVSTGVYMPKDAGGRCSSKRELQLRNEVEAARPSQTHPRDVRVAFL